MKKQIFSILILLTLVFAQGAKSQCPDILDGGGLPSASPIWISCVGADFNLFIQPVDTLFNYSIDWGDGSPVTTGDTLLPSAFETYLYTAGTFNYPVTITANCGVITGMVIMEISPSASIQIPLGSLAFGCAPASYSFVNSSTNVSPNTIFTWNWGDGSPLEIYGDTNLGDTLSHIYLPNTVGCEVTVTLSADNNCPPSSTNIFFPLQVWAVDNARITSDDTLLCYPDTVVHYDNTTVLNCFVNGNTFQRYEYWNFGDYWGLGYDSIIPWQPWNPPVRPGYDIAFPGLGVYTIMLIDSNFCGRDTTYSTIMIVDPPVAGLSPNPDTICSGESITFANLSAGANSYSWNFGDGSGWNTTGVGSQTHNYLTSGALTVFLAAIITGGSASCVDTASVVVEVLPSPQAIISPSATSGCDSLNVTFTDSSIAAVSWYWDFGNGDTSTSNVPPVISYGSPDTSIVQLLVTGLNGCQDSIADTITIYETPIVSFTATNVCVNQVTDFIDSSFTGGQPITSWNWDFGDGNTDTVQNPFNTYTSEGPQNVILTISTGFCTATDSAIIFVDTLPIPAFSVDTAAGCSPLTIAFSNTSSGAVSYEWDFGDSTTYIGFDTSHIFTYSGIDDTVYAVRLIATSDSGCMDTTMFSIQVYPPVFASFTQSDTAGCGPLSVDFTNTSLFGSMYFWDFGDGSPIDLAADPTHSFTNAGTEDTTYIIRLIIQSDDGCRDTAYSQMEIYPAPTAAFAATPISQMFPNTTVDFLNLSSVGNFDYAWDFGDGTTDTVMNPGPHTYTTWNSYTIGLIVSGNACSDTTEMVVTILQPPPTAGFTFSDSAGCRPAIFTFKDTSLYADSLMWDFGDGTPFLFTTDTQAISHIYYNSGIFVVALRAFGAGGVFDLALVVVEVHQLPVASFVINPNPAIIYLPDKPIYCLNLSTGAVNYQWDFGDGNSSVEVSPSHVYTAMGDYDIELIAISDYGCRDTLLKEEVVAVEEGGEIIFPSAFTPDPSGPGDGIYDPNSFNNDIFHPYWDGVDTYLLRVFSRWGELIFETEDVNQGWDGYYRGEMVLQDVYVWKANVLFENGEQRTMAGDVTLLR